MDFKYCKLEIFLPPSHLEVLQKALQEVDAGHIGNYDSCMSVSPVTGYWRPLDGCNPYIGRNGEISCEPELTSVNNHPCKMCNDAVDLMIRLVQGETDIPKKISVPCTIEKRCTTDF